MMITDSSSAPEKMMTRRAAAPLHLWVGLVAGLLWLGGFGSIVAVATAMASMTGSRSADTAPPRLAMIVMTVGLIGLAITAVSVLAFMGSTRQ